MAWEEPKLIPYERIYSDAPSAERILAQGWSSRHCPTVHLDRAIPWDTYSEDLRSWSYDLHAWKLLEPILEAYDETGALRYLHPALNVAMDWVRRHVHRGSDDPGMAWYDMAVGLRSYRMGFIMQAAASAGILVPDDHDLMWASLEVHRELLADDRNISMHSNHGFYQIAGQIALGRRFRAVSPKMDQLFEQGQQRLHEIVDLQFTGEGVHREHSPGYHSMVAMSLTAIHRAGLIEAGDVAERILAIEGALAWFIDPSGHVINLGDSDHRRLTASPWTSPVLRSLASGESSASTPTGLRCFQESGYAVVRTPSREAGHDRSTDDQLVLSAAFHSRTHKQADDLNFVFHHRGRPIIIDAGRYGYIGRTERRSPLWEQGFWYSHPMRIFVESTRAHNTVEFDGLDAPRRGVQPYGSGITHCSEQAGIFVLAATVKQFGTIRINRTLLYRPGEWLIILDWFKDYSGKPHDVTQWLHLAPDLEATMAEDGFKVQIPEADGFAIGSLIAGPRADGIRLGIQGDRPQGWWSPKGRTAEPAPALSFVIERASTGAFATIVAFDASLRPDRKRSAVNASGRRARLAWWSDGNEALVSHELVAATQDDGSVVVEYQCERTKPSREYSEHNNC